MPLCTLLLIEKLKARHSYNIEKRLTDHSGRRVVDSPQTVLQPAECDGEKTFSDLLLSNMGSIEIMMEMLQYGSFVGFFQKYLINS